MYAGGFVTGPAADEPGTTGVCDEADGDGVEDGEVGAEDRPPEEGAPDGAGDAPAFVGAPPRPFPGAAPWAVDPEPLDEHPAAAAETMAIAAIAAPAIPRRFLIMPLTRQYSRCSSEVNAK